jgi:hypothetical protein
MHTSATSGLLTSLQSSRDTFRRRKGGGTGDRRWRFLGFVELDRSVMVWDFGGGGVDSNFTSIDPSIRSTNSSETFGIVRVPHGKLLAKSSCPKTHRMK